MNKPSNYESIKTQGEFIPLPAGGYVCKVMQVLETKSKSGLEMLQISLDIAEGEFKNYFTDAYKNDTRDQKKWGCIAYLVVDENTDYGTKNLKGFVTSVENSNTGFNVVWGDNFAKCFKGKLVGAIFGREQYESNTGIHWSTKFKWFRGTDTIKSGNFQIPEDKYLPDGVTSRPTPNQVNDGFMNIPDGIDEELPFM